MKDKPIAPYARLLDSIKRFAYSVKYPRRRTMWTYPKNKLNDSWALGDLAQRVQAAEQLGYDVHLRNTADGLVVEYVKHPDVPCEWA